jgi:uncharacterized protein (TIGR02996 family)
VLTDAELAPFLAAIAERPWDALPRLILADACDERGDPLGEWLRLDELDARAVGADAMGPGGWARWCAIRDTPRRFELGLTLLWHEQLMYRRAAAPAPVTPGERPTHAGAPRRKKAAAVRS